MSPWPSTPSIVSLRWRIHPGCGPGTAPTTAGWLSLAVILDLYSRRVIGWAMGHRLTVELAEQEPTGGLLHHSDRGSQYAATRYQLVLPTHGITTRMSRKGNC